MLASRRASETSQRIDIARRRRVAVADEDVRTCAASLSPRRTAVAAARLSPRPRTATMPRVSSILDAAAAPSAARDATPFERVFALRRNLFEDFRRFYALFWEQRLVDPVILELCRLRIAQLHGCEPELRVRYQPALDAGLDEAKIAALAERGDSPPISEARARLRRASPSSSRSTRTRSPTPTPRAWSRQLGDAGTVALVEALALFDGFTRFRLMLGVEPPDGARASCPRRARAPVRSTEERP